MTRKNRITNLEWMTDATKVMALRKLDAIGRKIAAPDVWPETALDSVELRSYADGGSLVENIEAIFDANLADIYALEGTEVDHSEWITVPQEINAFYNPVYNDINFPLAIIQLPIMYSEDRSYAANLGAMAVVLEIASSTVDFDYEAMFEAYSQVWMVVMTREDALDRSMTDTHSPASVRVNRVLQAFDKFYEVYGITEGDGMWVAPENRVSIW